MPALCGSPGIFCRRACSKQRPCACKVDAATARRHNSRHGLGRSGVLAGLLYFILFTLSSLAGYVCLTVTAHGVLAECNGSLPRPPLPRHKPLVPEWGAAGHRRLLQSAPGESGPYPAPSAHATKQCQPTRTADARPPLQQLPALSVSPRDTAAVCGSTAPSPQHPLTGACVCSPRVPAGNNVVCCHPRGPGGRCAGGCPLRGTAAHADAATLRDPRSGRSTRELLGLHIVLSPKQGALAQLPGRCARARQGPAQAEGLWAVLTVAVPACRQRVWGLLRLVPVPQLRAVPGGAHPAQEQCGVRPVVWPHAAAAAGAGPAAHSAGQHAPTSATHGRRRRQQLTSRNAAVA